VVGLADTVGSIRNNCNTMQQLTPQQGRAIELLLGGMRETEVAAEVGIDRTTLWRWKRENDFFRAELNARRQEGWDGATEQLST
jgi:DNA invertase Pin-like site-specific DNA recombinase